MSERIDLGPFETDTIETVLARLTWYLELPLNFGSFSYSSLPLMMVFSARLTWYLELLAEEIDDWFPNDPEPIVQDDLRRLAGLLQRRFGFETLREMLGPEKTERLIDSITRKHRAPSEASR